MLYLTNSTINDHLLTTGGHQNKDANTVLFRQHKLGCHENEILKPKHALQEVASWDTRDICIMSVQHGMASHKTQTSRKGKKEQQRDMDQFKNILSKKISLHVSLIIHKEFTFLP